MGKGLALQFKRAFPENFTSYAEACRAGEVELGHVFPVLIKAGRWIINFPTKGDWRQRSQLSDIKMGLRDLANVIPKLGISSIAIPPLGCGQGGLPWPTVRKIIMDELEDVNAEVRLYQPGTPSPEQMPNRTSRPHLTKRYAYLLATFARYINTALLAGVADSDRMSLIEIHKVTYLLQSAGSPLGYRFEQGHYGPFSAELNRTISMLEGHYLVGFGDGTGGARADVYLLPPAESAKRIVEDDRAFLASWEKVRQVIYGYEYPEGVELLASVHYLASREKGQLKAEKIVSELQAWNERKRRLFPADDVTNALKHLAESSLLPPLDG